MMAVDVEALRIVQALIYDIRSQMYDK